MYKISIIGATGYVGLELARLLCGHGGVKIEHLFTTSAEGQQLDALYPSLRGAGLPPLETYSKEAALSSDLVFTALPHGAGGGVIPELYRAGGRVIDMSADYRLNDIAVYEQWYKSPHPCPEINGDAVYGLCELYRDRIKPTRLAANPGCYTSCAILACAPLMKSGLIDIHSIIIDAASGVSGAGRSLSQGMHFTEAHETYKAYGVTTHRHTPEIEQELSLAAGEPVYVTFTPHLLPVKRGILSTIYVNLKDGVTQEQLMEVYTEKYAGEPFITLYPKGELPELKHVNGSNRCAIGFAIDKRTGRAIIVSALDNLGKGAAGAGVQNMNLMLGMPETQGLTAPAWYL